MTGYVPPPFELDSQVLLQRADDDLRSRHPDVELKDGSLIRWMVETDAQTAADVAALAQEVGEGIIREVLARLLGEPQWPATPAAGLARLTVSGGTTVTIPAGTYLEGTLSSGEPFTVVTVTDTTINAEDTVAAGVPVTAVDAGAHLRGADGDLLGMEVWPWGVSATLDAPLTGGTDAETPEAHLIRLVRLARLARPRPIKPDEFAEYVALKTPGVGAAVALNMTTPAGETGVERYVTVGVRTVDGVAPPGEVITAAQAALDAVREVTFEAPVVAANYTTVTVEATVRVWPGYDDAQTKQLAADAIRRYLSPATWGAPPRAGDDSDGIRWANQTTVRREEIVEALGSVPGVDFAPITAIKINGVAGDLVMGGLLPLPIPGAAPDDIDITVEPR